MSVSANCDLVSLLDVMLHHGRLFLDEFCDCDDDLVNIFFSQLFPVDETFNHVFNELWCHLVLQLRTVIARLEGHALQIQPLRSRRRIFNLDSLEERISLDDLVALCHAQFCVRIVGRLLHDKFPVAQSLSMLEDGKKYGKNGGVETTNEVSDNKTVDVGGKSIGFVVPWRSMQAQRKELREKEKELAEALVMLAGEVAFTGTHALTHISA